VTIRRSALRQAAESNGGKLRLPSAPARIIDKLGRQFTEASLSLSGKLNLPCSKISTDTYPVPRRKPATNDSQT
jgi:hypothetical protein